MKSGPYLVLAALLVSAPVPAKPPIERLELPPGFTAEVLIEDLDNARAMALGDKGTLFVGTRDAGNVYALELSDGAVSKRHTIASGLRMPSGLTFNDGSLYVSAIQSILRYDGIEASLAKPAEPVVVTDQLPSDRHHGWKHIAFGPDGWLYVPIGAPCNICDEGLPYAAIHRMRADGSDMQLVAAGVRNSVGFDWNPADDSLWFSDNGRDMMGDDIPPCELNRVSRLGEHFGYPYCHGDSVADPKYGKQQACWTSTPPQVEFDAHTAPLGVYFYRGTLFPQRYRKGAFVALHGSWNRSSKIGYQVLWVPINGEKAGKPEVFVDGFLDGETTLGRPVAFTELDDGSLLVSDDYADAIYRIRYVGE